MNKKTKKVLLIIGIVLISIFLLFSTVPYLTPLPHTNPTQTKEDLMAAEGKFITVDDRQMYYEDYGDKNAKETIILVHGFGGSTHTFRHNISYLVDQGFRVIAVDLLGYGLSDKDFDSDYSHPAHASRLNKFMNELDISESHFIGHSMGSSVVTHFAHMYPDKTNSLILVTPAIDTMRIEPRMDAARITAPLLKYPPIKRLARLILRGYFFPNNVDQILRTAYYNDEHITKDIYTGYADRIITGDWDLSLLGATRDYKHNTTDFPLKEIEAPTIIIAGEEDTWVPLKQSENLNKEFQDARFELVPESGHLLIEERPDQFNDIVGEFLGEYK